MAGHICKNDANTETSSIRTCLYGAYAFFLRWLSDRPDPLVFPLSGNSSHFRVTVEATVKAKMSRQRRRKD
jgi:hypothetical protein